MSAYHRDGPNSMDRLMRDSLGSLMMVSIHRCLVDNVELHVAKKQI